LRWVYLKQRKIIDTDFQRFITFDEFADNFQNFSFVYAHPLHAVQLYKVHGFIPLAKYTETYDEAAVISSKSIASPSISKMHDQKVALVKGTPSHAAILIDLSKNYPAVEIDPVTKGTYPDVLMAVSIEEAQYGIILKSVWDQMISMKERVNHFYTTEIKELVHVLMINPNQREIAVSVQKALLEMHNDPEGRKILARLKCDSFTVFGDRGMEELVKNLAGCVF